MLPRRRRVVVILCFQNSDKKIKKVLNILPVCLRVWLFIRRIFLQKLQLDIGEIFLESQGVTRKTTCYIWFVFWVTTLEKTAIKEIFLPQMRGSYYVAGMYRLFSAAVAPSGGKWELQRPSAHGYPSSFVL